MPRGRLTGQDVDAAVEATFPASDPVALSVEEIEEHAAPAFGPGGARRSTVITQTEKTKDRFVGWLRSAHAMERSLETVLSAQAEHASKNNDQGLEARLRTHLQETRRHAEMLEEILDRYDADRSVMKDAVGKMQAMMHGMMNSMSPDTAVKDVLAGVMAEHFEIACYRSLETAARELGDEETARVCQDIIRDEEAMASFLEEQIPKVTKMELAAAAV